MLFFSKCLVHVHVLFIDTIFISILCVSHKEPSVIESNWQICDFYKWVIFDISKLLIHCNTDSCYEDITGGVNICLYGCVSLLASISLYLSLCVCVRVCACVRACMRAILNQSTIKKLHYVSDHIKLDALLHKTHCKVYLVLWYHEAQHFKIHNIIK